MYVCARTYIHVCIIMCACIMCVLIVSVCVNVLVLVCVQAQIACISHLDTQPPHLQNENSHENQYPGVDIQLN